MNRRGFFKGLLALMAGALLPRRLHGAVAEQSVRKYGGFTPMYLTVTEKWTRDGGAFRIEDGPWIPYEVQVQRWPLYLTAGAPALENLRKALDAE